MQMHRPMLHEASRGAPTPQPCMDMALQNCAPALQLAACPGCTIEQHCMILSEPIKRDYYTVSYLTLDKRGPPTGELQYCRCDSSEES